MKRSLPVLASLLFLAIGQTIAGPVEDLTRLVRESQSSSSPAMAFLRGLASLQNFDLGEADVKRVLSAANAPAGSEIQRLLGPVTRFKKQGDQLSLDRKETTRVSMNGAQLELGKSVRLRLRVQNADNATIDSISGVRGGEAGGKLYTIYEVRFLKEGGKPVAKVTGGVNLLVTTIKKTITIDLSTAATTASAAPVRGITNMLR